MTFLTLAYVGAHLLALFGIVMLLWGIARAAKQLWRELELQRRADALQIAYDTLVASLKK